MNRTTARRRKLVPVHPGEVLREEFLKPLKLTAMDLSRGIGVTPDRVTRILHGEQSVSPDTAIRLARFFRTSARFWLSLQAIYDLAVAEAENPHSEITHWRTHFHDAMADLSEVSDGPRVPADDQERRVRDGRRRAARLASTKPALERGS